MLNRISEEIAGKEEGKRPIIIFEDLDKLNPEDAWKVFYNYAVILSGMSFPVIYTFSIALSYDVKFSAMESYFITKTLPMIKIGTIENKPFDDGITVIGRACWEPGIWKLQLWTMYWRMCTVSRGGMKKRKNCIRKRWL